MRKKSKKVILKKDGYCCYFPFFLRSSESDYYYQELLEQTPWREGKISLFGKSYWQPRLFAWHADKGCSYSYSGARLCIEPWSPALAALKGLVEKNTGYVFNSALLNLYRDESDSMGLHQDDEKELGDRPTIASISLGDTRRFILKHNAIKQEIHCLDLAHGSLLLMQNQTQNFWKHGVPKQKLPAGPRINITFRRIFPVNRPNERV